MRALNITRFFACLMLVLWHAIAQAVSQISITAQNISHPNADAKNLTITLDLENSQNFSIQSAIKTTQFPEWTNLQLNCDLAKNNHSAPFNCLDGLIKNKQINLPFSIEINRIYQNKQIDVQAMLKIKGASFSDEAGLHAAEKLTANFNVEFAPNKNGWAWKTNLDWQNGEVFWQPFYFANGGHQLIAHGQLQEDTLQIEHADLHLKNVGDLSLNGTYQLSNKQIIYLNADLPKLDLATAFPLLFKPFLEKTAFSHAQIAGQAAVKFSIKNNQLVTSQLTLTDVDIADDQQKFAFYKLNADLPWNYDIPQNVQLSYQSGELLKMPLGATNISAEVDRYSVTSPNVRLPILDGALNLSDISAARIGQQWFWHLRAVLEPVSMADLSVSLNIPRMTGQASAEIPMVTYNDGLLTTDGDLTLKVFDGVATIRHLTMKTPLGSLPILNANITLRNLDLGNLTRTFSFGAIEGKLDGDISELTLENWKPIKFDAKVQSSAGKYPKKISQRAVENISALGGAGATAAIQRSVLRFFEQFNYEKLGLSCKLRNDICKMAGVESTLQGYIIVKGSGIPAITVMGYNQTVGWGDLLARIQRVIDGNSKAVIK